MIIEVDSHTHTIASGHAFSTLAENAQAASQQNIKLLAITDHGPTMPGAPHIWYFLNMRVIPRVINGVGILRGIEANILNYDGEIDIQEPVLEKMDIILASLHEPVISPSTKIIHTDTVIKAMASGKIDVFAHGGNPSFPIDAEEVAKAAAFYNVLIEINNSSFTTSRPGSEKNCLQLANYVAKHEGKLIFGSDAHIASKVGKFDECLSLIKEINFPPDRVLSFSAQNTMAFLLEKNKQNLEELLPLIS